MKIKTFVVDAFTDVAFKGNPAGVCLLENELDVSIMQSIANELKHSETAFVKLMEGDTYSIRYFTPTVEIDFCGHATLGSSKVVLEYLNKKEVHFNTHHGLHLSAKKDNNKIVMKFPLYDTVPYSVHKETLDALKLSECLDARYAHDLQMLVIRVADKKTVDNLNPDYKRLVASDSTPKEVVVTAVSADKDYHFYSRCFCPWIGIDEDPVTGAAHSVIAKYWSHQLQLKEMKAYQCSERGGYLTLSIKSESELQVTSNAMIVLTGEINI